MMKVNAQTLPEDPWGDGAKAWRLLDRDDMAIAEETIPAGVGETRHFHAHTRQFFYVLEGTLSIELEGDVHRLGPGDGLEIAPGAKHRAHNADDKPVRFLVASSGLTKRDRTNLG
ncbi:cupin domain-containing protein [Kordiimonas marina]|uniref:cupin domain-containing protein n=1 Tax=Kordiimonas marina TaxID=2872312 RepID=UPI001FF26634|nr:cupin domain-containing protein [Kordiimonas marina]MCJ9429465.1 cupin domain-containing protein [Kordiimonas marina]